MTPEDHEAKFHQVSRNLNLLAQLLAQQHPEFPAIDFARCFLTVAVSGLLTATNAATTAQYLRQLAARLDADPESVN
jgi:hypothetical protein